MPSPDPTRRRNSPIDFQFRPRASSPLPDLMKSARLSLFAFTLIAAFQLHAAEPPNIVLMMADDMGMGDTSAYQFFTGNADDVQVHTPNMERLARRGMLFTDAHTPSTRCTATRYGLMTGRYPWRSRMKYWVLFGSQGDPLIEDDRPTMASMLRDSGYRTGMFGKWHIGLRYRQSDGSPAAGFLDADFNQPLHTGPTDRGFDVAMFTSRSHGTSGPHQGKSEGGKARNTPDQDIGPGHINGKAILGATGDGRKLSDNTGNLYDLFRLGGRHSDNAIQFMNDHIRKGDSRKKPFFVYYPSNSNHSPYKPDDEIGGKAVLGASRTKSGKAMDLRHDYIYENDVALGRLMEWLESNEDPRRPGRKLIENTIVIFTSDNGAEKNSNIASGPFRSHKGSCYEGGHRVPFIISWPQGGVGDGKDAAKGLVSQTTIGLQDLYATFSEILGKPLPDPTKGEKGAEDSISILPALMGKPMPVRPFFVNDHKEARKDQALLVMRHERWKIFFEPSLLRTGSGKAVELYDLSKDQMEKNNLIKDPVMIPVVERLTRMAHQYRQVGRSRMMDSIPSSRVSFDWQESGSAARESHDKPASGLTLSSKSGKLKLAIKGSMGNQPLKEGRFSINPRGLGIDAGKVKQVEGGEALLLSFDRDVIIESVGIVAGNGSCGGFYQMGNSAPLAIYCVDADNDSKEQQAVISDLGLLKKGETLRLDSSRHYGVEPEGQWRLGNITVRPL